jgi:hypothetical protein
MKSHQLALAAALVATLAGVCPRTALAAGRSCPGMSIEVDASFRARFSDLLERIQSELAARSDVDACARVALRLEGDRVITMSVTLPDGRTAARSVTRREDVIPTLQALLLVPVPSLATPTAAAAAAPAPVAPSAPAAPRRALRLNFRSRPDRDVPPATSGARHLGVELSLLTGARVGDGQLGMGVGALSFLEVHGWLLGFEGRADSYRAILGGDPETALELAALAGRRFDFGGLALDFTAGPAVAMKGLAFSNTTTVARLDMSMNAVVPPPPPQSDPSSGPVPRLLLGARFGFTPRSVFRTFVGVDGEIGPARVPDDAPAGSARLPTFSLGLALGATVGTP